MPTPAQSRRQRRLALGARIVLISIVCGAGFGAVIANHNAPDIRLTDPAFASSLLRGGANGFFVGGLIYTLETLSLDPPLSHWLRRIPFLLMFGLRSLAYLICILLGFALADVLTALPDDSFDPFGSGVILVSLAFAIVFNLVVSVDRLLGHGVLVNVLFGRYAQPRREELLVAMVDVAKSSKAASELGDLKFFRFLNAIFTDVEEAITMNGGQVHKYLGDGMIVVWSIARGLPGGSALQDCLGAISSLEARSNHYLSIYGRAPAIRIALHIGPVVAGELGEYRREIAFIGDTLNATAQIETAAKGLAPGLFVSDTTMARMGRIPDLAIEPLAPVALKGHPDPIGISRVAVAKSKAGTI